MYCHQLAIKKSDDDMVNTKGLSGLTEHQKVG